MKPEQRTFHAYLEDMIVAMGKILRYISTVKDARFF